MSERRKIDLTRGTPLQRAYWAMILRAARKLALSAYRRGHHGFPAGAFFFGVRAAIDFEAWRPQWEEDLAQGIHPLDFSKAARASRAARRVIVEEADEESEKAHQKMILRLLEDRS